MYLSSTSLWISSFISYYSKFPFSILSFLPCYFCLILFPHTKVKLCLSLMIFIWKITNLFMFCHFLPLLELILALGKQISHIYNRNCIFISGQCIFFPTWVKIIYYSCNMTKNQMKHITDGHCIIWYNS